MRQLPALLLALALLGCSSSLPTGHVPTEYGVISSTNSRVDGIHAWHGIPFAASPVGDIRWKAPQPPNTWESVRAGDAFGNRCMQTNPFPDMIWNSSAESEDCLYLSVWAPENSRKLPVMVWIHGGGYFSGSGDEHRHDGSMLASHDVIVVTINYRLGVFGFMAHPELTAEEGAAGNYGLMDMVAALEWIRGNIEGFGGDPDNVTIFGESAGSFAVSALMASPQAEGLFHRAIGQSGGHFGASAIGMPALREAEVRGTAFAEALGASDLAQLRSVSAENLRDGAASGGAGFNPIVDGAFLPEDPMAVFAAGRQNDVPLMAGWTSAEAKWMQPSLVEFQAMLRSQFPDRYDQAAAVYPAVNDAEARTAGVTLASDGFVVFGTWMWLRWQARTGSSSTYRYIFDQVMASPAGPVPADDPGAGHATDIPFVFHRLDVTGSPVSDADTQVADLMVDYWTNFARNGNPNGSGLPEWPTWNGDSQVMWLNDAPMAMPPGDTERFEFLEQAWVTDR